MNGASARARVLAAIVAVAVLVVLGAWLLRGTGPCDDDFIVYRYARNLVHGNGLVFEPGERVEGYTCPLWVLACAAAIATGVAPALASQALGYASVFAAAALALVPRGPRAIASHVLPALAIACTAALAFHASQGLGTATCAALVLAWYVASARAEHRGGSYALASTLLALATLLRPETAAIAAPFVLLAPRGKRLACAAPIAVIAGGWLAFRVAYYGEWLPMTWWVKRLPIADDLAYGARYLWSSTLDTGIAALLAACVVARARRFALVDRSATAALAGAVLATLAVVSVGGDYMFLARFLVPLVPLAIVLAGEVLERVATKHGALAVAGWIALFAVVARPWTRVGELRTWHAFDEERWIAIGRELARRAPPGTTLATAPVGAIGFESALPIVDLLGRTNAALRDAPPDLAITMKGHHRYDAEWVLSRSPDLVVLGNGVLVDGRRLEVSQWERTLYLHPRFRAEWEPRTVPVEGSYALLYFHRRGAPDLAGSVAAN